VSEGSGSSDGALWAGRFRASPAPEAHALGRSLHYDVRLAPFDVRASIAHVGALQAAGLLSEAEAGELEAALASVAEDIAAGSLAIDPADEDVHSAVERAVTQRLGDLGAKLHAGRSRNDLVVTDVRLWLDAAGGALTEHVEALVSTLIARAREHAATVMPGTTHARFAQPVTLGHHLLAHAWGLMRDRERLTQWAERTSTSAIGAGATATSTLGLDPAATAQRLGMRRAFSNSIDAVSDRDFVQEFLAVAVILATHVSRLSADLARWTDESLGWARLDEAYSTGSSMMPQKRNPDTAELARAKAARITGDFVAIASLLQGLPLGYHRDLQEDKEPLFDAVDTLELALPAIAGAVATVRFDTEAMRTACADDGLYATDLAEALVKAGVPFREAHRRTGELLRDLDDRDRNLGDLDADEWAAFGVPGGATMLDPDASVAARSGVGGPSPDSVGAQIEALERQLSGT
jgi:argininosuccinate lyase